MKVRWNRSSVRLRISPSEMAALTRGETICERIPFADRFVWSITVAPAPELEVTCLAEEANGLTVRLALQDRARLACPEAEGVYFSQPAPCTGEAKGDGRSSADTSRSATLRYYIEKDFPCVHPRPPEAAEPESETFLPPAGFRERHLARC
jgi:hypothetical protein